MTVRPSRRMPFNRIWRAVERRSGAWMTFGVIPAFRSAPEARGAKCYLVAITFQNWELIPRDLLTFCCFLAVRRTLHKNLSRNCTPGSVVRDFRGFDGTGSVWCGSEPNARLLRRKERDASARLAQIPRCAENACSG